MMPYRPVTTQTAAFTASSAAVSNAFGAGVNVVRLSATQDCHVAFAGAPVATTSDMPIKAGREEYFVVTPGQKVAAIRTTADGTLFCTEMTK